MAVLLPALRSSQDITVEGPMSERLYYNIRNTVIYLFSTAFGYKPINIKAEKLVHPHFDNFAVGCGCSLGVDSFAAMLSHMEDLHPYGNPSGYQITHLTYFNVGAHGYKNLEKVEASYKKDLEMVKAFAESINRPLVCINSNIHILFDGFNFDQSGDTRNMCAVLSMQKFFQEIFVCFIVSDKGVPTHSGAKRILRDSASAIFVDRKHGTDCSESESVKNRENRTVGGQQTGSEPSLCVLERAYC